MRRIVTLKQVAKRANVAPITASRVLNNSGYASVEIRERVLRAANELNYTLNASAQELASQSGRARMLAIVLPHLDNPFFVRVLEGTSGVADKFGYDLLIYCSRGDAINDKRALEALRRRRVEGLIYVLEVVSPLEAYMTCWLVSQSHSSSLKTTFLSVNAELGFVDNHKAGYEATRHLVEQGYHRIAVIGGEPDIKPDRDRLVGYQQAVEKPACNRSNTL
jgi:LacI family transcriptional regulator